MRVYTEGLEQRHPVHRAKYSLIYFARWSLRNSRIAQISTPLLRWSFTKSINVFASHKYKLVYQGIPKNASSTLYNWQLMLDGVLKPGEYKGHAEISREFIHELNFFNSSDWRDYRHFAFVRNPFARLVSRYSHWNGHEIMEFEEYVRAVCKVPNHMRDRHIRTQLSLLHFPMLDFIGRIENFSDDMRKIIDRYQLPPESYDFLPHLKKGNYGDYRKYYSTATRQLVEKHYRKDLDTFGYSF